MGIRPKSFTLEGEPNLQIHAKKCLDWFLKATFKALSDKKKSYGLKASIVS